MTTIAAVSTPLGSGGISIIRLSGSESIEIASRFFSSGNLKPQVFEDRKLYLGKFDGDGFKEQCLCVVFRSPNSFTGEDVVEFQIHGGITLTNEVLKTCLSAGAVLAQPGEFTRRAFLNNKLSLSAAEGTLALLNANSKSGVTAATELINERLSSKVKTWTNSVIDIIASIEVALDYPEEDIEAHALTETKTALEILIKDFERLASTFKSGRAAQNGINVTIAGKPNVGKSSLLNALIGEERAIVTDIAGTTRDILKERIEYNNVAINFIDTAGIRSDAGNVEKIGINLARKAITTADIILFLCDNTFDSDDQIIFQSLPEDIPVLKVLNKSDLISGEKTAGSENGFLFDILISAETGNNTEKLKELIYQKVLSDSFDQSGEMLVLQRHYACIEGALAAVKNALNSTELNLITVDLRAALSYLYEITGENVTEQVIDRIFDKFCLGK